MKKFLNLVAIVILAAISICLMLISFEGFWQMINTRDNVGFFLKFFGAGFGSLAVAGGASVLIDKLFKAVVNQDKWHNTMLYKLGRAISIRSQKKILGTVEYVLENWN